MPAYRYFDGSSAEVCVGDLSLVRNGPQLTLCTDERILIAEDKIEIERARKGLKNGN